MAKPKPKKQLRPKTLSFEHYARAIQTDIAQLGKKMTEGFKSIREEMATKQDIRNIRDEMATKEALRDVREDVQNLNNILVSKTDLKDTIRRELDASPFVKEADIKDLRDRLRRVEEKLGIEPAHRAA